MPLHTSSRFPPLRVVLLLLVAALLAACGGGEKAPATEPEPERILQSAGANPQRRAEVIRSLWGQVVAGEAPAEPLRTRLKDLFWDRQQPTEVRVAIAEAFLSDIDDERLQDTRRMLRLALATEPDPAVREVAAAAAAERGWTDYRDGLVRALSLPADGAIAARPEARALAELFPERSLGDHAWELFLDPPAGGDEMVNLAERARRDAWDLLMRLEQPDEIARRLSSTEPPPPVVAALRRAWNDFGLLPMTGQEVEWLEQMTADSAAWREASAAAERLTPSQREGLALRHLTPLRWAAANRPAWLEASREQLLGELAGRLRGRTVHQRKSSPTHPDSPSNRERLEDWRSRLNWGDALSLLALDVALQSEAVWEAAFPQAESDRKDTETEHGGMIFLTGDAGRAVAYGPRRGERFGDFRFVAPPQMLREGAWALAQYHLHARERFGSRAAGPSEPDIYYAALSGRTCAVFTTLSDSRMNADAYLPNGAVIDLGEFRQP